MGELHDRKLIHDWNSIHGAVKWPAAVSIIDDTLYEGPHAPHVTAPQAAAGLEFIGCCERLRLQSVNLGAVTAASMNAIESLVAQIGQRGLGIVPLVTASTDEESVSLASRLRKSASHPLDVALVVHTSGIVHHASGTPLDEVLHRLTRALEATARDGFYPRLMLHDATRAHPGTLRRLLVCAMLAGATRLCLWDSAGCASPAGTARLLDFVRGVADDNATPVHLEWFGRNDRDLAIVNCLEALQHGVRTLHGTALGLGHGAGNAALDILLANLSLLEVIDRDVSSLKNYCDTAARAYGVSIPVNYPIFGGDAFRTATGVHAAAIIKAQQKGDHWLADRVYSGVPAGLFGLHQIIDVGPMSGESNVVAWLRHRGIEPQAELVKRIIRRAKSSTHILSGDEMQQEIAAFSAETAKH